MPAPIYNQIYDLDYYSDSQAMVYIGDVWVDDITSIHYTCSQQKTPIYGYASQLFDDTAAGHVIVQGEFSINFKEQGYLWAVLRRWFDMGPGAPEFAVKGLYDPVAASKAKKLIAGKIKPGQHRQGGRPIVGSNGTLVSRASIERIAQGEATTQERYNYYNDLAGYATFDVKNNKDKVFEDIVEAFEDEVWKTTDNENLLNQIRRVDDNAFDGFDIFLTFGNYSVPGANHSVIKLVSCRLTSSGKSIQVGQNMPIQEFYTFTARTIV